MMSKSKKRGEVRHSARGTITSNSFSIAQSVKAQREKNQNQLEGSGEPMASKLCDV